MDEIFDENDVEKIDLVGIHVDGIYPTDDGLLPDRMAKLIPEAWESLQKVIQDINEYGGHFRLTDAFRSGRDQMKAHLDYKMGRKNQYSPPPGRSMHEAGRAIDIDFRYETLNLKQTKVAEILREHGWNSIVESLGDPTLVDVKEEHHWEFRKGLHDIYDKHGYNGMVEYGIKQVDNYPDDDFIKESNELIVKDVQSLLDDIGIDAGPVDGEFGPKTERGIREFQKKYQIKVDGKLDYELVLKLLKVKNSDMKNDDKRHKTVQKFDRMINKIDSLSDDLENLKRDVMEI